MKGEFHHHLISPFKGEEFYTAGVLLLDCGDLWHKKADRFTKTCPCIRKIVVGLATLHPPYKG